MAGFLQSDALFNNCLKWDFEDAALAAEWFFIDELSAAMKKDILFSVICVSREEGGDVFYNLNPFLNPLNCTETHVGSLENHLEERSLHLSLTKLKKHRCFTMIKYQSEKEVREEVLYGWMSESLYD